MGYWLTVFGNSQVANNRKFVTAIVNGTPLVLCETKGQKQINLKNKNKNKNIK